MKYTYHAAGEGDDGFRMVYGGSVRTKTYLCSQGRAWLNSSTHRPGDATGLGPDLRERRGRPGWRSDRDDRPPETASVDSARYPDLQDYLLASISTLVALTPPSSIPTTSQLLE